MRLGGEIIVYMMMIFFKEDYVYTGGGTIVPENHNLFSVCCPEQNQSCEEIVSTHYYSSRLQCEMCCYNCGVFGDLKPISDEAFRAICTDCSTQGKKEHTRGPKFAGTKRTAILLKQIFNFSCGLSYFMNTICVFGRALSGNPMRKLQYICMLCFFFVFFFFFFFGESVKFNERGG